MCGIIGVTGVSMAAERALLGLYALQHRGQEAAGIAAVDHGCCHVEKAEGAIAEGFNDEVLSRLPGPVALGHSRYSTAGGAGLVNSQPFRAVFAGGDLGLVHNGNLTNAFTIRDRLVQEGSIFQTTTDSEVIIHLIAKSRRPELDGKVDDALSQLEGAFSVILTIGDALYAARDPQGFRPLALGTLPDGGWVLASETCSFDILHAKFERNLEPGEVIRIINGKVTSLRPLPTKRGHAPCIFELVYFSRPDSMVFGESVDRARRAFGRALAREHPVEADCVFSVPDSSNSAALGFSEESGIPFELGLIRNHYVGRTFIHPTQAGRDYRVRLKYNAVREVVNGKRVIVVDDSLVRGTTSRALVSMIREAGAKEVHFRVGSPPVVSPCYYGIDMPTKKELIGAQLDVEGIRAKLGVDSLGYLSLEGMTSAVERSGPFCTACFSGNYPTPLTDLNTGRVTRAGPDD